MSCDLYTALEQLYSNGLYSCVVELYPFLEASQLLCSAEAANAALYQAASLQHLKELKRAEGLYKNTLQSRKFILKNKFKSGEASDGLIFTETEVKFRMSECYVGMGQSNQAVNILQSIPAKQRSAKINLALGKLYQQSGMERPAIAAYREVLKDCPLAIEAIRCLFQLGVKLKEIQEFSPESLAQELSFLPSILSIQAALYAKDYAGCVRECKKLEKRPELRGCTSILVPQGIAHYWAGEHEQARIVLQRAASLDPMLLNGMDTLAAILASLSRVKELDQLATRLMSVSEDRPEPWVAMGHYCHLIKKSQRAVFFAHKACLIDTRNVEALLLKGNVLLDLKKLADSMNHFREALQLAPHRYEPHKGMVECYLGLGRQREAANVATSACKQMANSPQALTLYASVLLKESLSVARAKSLLERAAAGGYLQAVYLLVDLLDREGAVDKAIQLLKTSLGQHSNCRLHQLLADLLAKHNQEEAAMEHYSLALSLNPKSEGALSGLHRMEAGGEGGLEASYDMEMAEIGSPHGSIGQGSPGGGGGGGQLEPEDSETEAVWSDGDLNMMGGGS